MPIPWEGAQEFAESFNKDVIVIMAFDDWQGDTTVVTWGRTLAQKEYAAERGNRLKEILGWAPEDCKAVSAKVQVLINSKIELVKFLKNMRSVISLASDQYNELKLSIDAMIKIAERGLEDAV